MMEAGEPNSIKRSSSGTEVGDDHGHKSGRIASISEENSGSMNTDLIYSDESFVRLSKASDRKPIFRIQSQTATQMSNSATP